VFVARGRRLHGLTLLRPGGLATNGNRRATLDLSPMKREGDLVGAKWNEVGNVRGRSQRQFQSLLPRRVTRYLPALDAGDGCRTDVWRRSTQRLGVNCDGTRIKASRWLFEDAASTVMRVIYEQPLHLSLTTPFPPELLILLSTPPTLFPAHQLAALTSDHPPLSLWRISHCPPITIHHLPHHSSLGAISPPFSCCPSNTNKQQLATPQVCTARYLWW